MTYPRSILVQSEFEAAVWAAAFALARLRPFDDALVEADRAVRELRAGLDRRGEGRDKLAGDA